VILLASLIYIKHNRERRLVTCVPADWDQGARLHEAGRTMTVRAQKNESNGTGDPDKPSPDFTLVDDMRVPQRVELAREQGARGRRIGRRSMPQAWRQ